MKSLDKELINSVLWRVTEIEKHFGTVTDKLAIEMAYSSSPDFATHEVSNFHISVFKRIVRTGVISTPKFRPPNGHKILDFLISLKAKQDEIAASKSLEMEAEQFDMLKKTWVKIIGEFEGDETKAKQKMVTLWGKGQMNETTKGLFNNSYKSALSEWNTLQDQK